MRTPSLRLFEGLLFFYLQKIEVVRLRPFWIFWYANKKNIKQILICCLCFPYVGGGGQKVADMSATMISFFFWRVDSVICSYSSFSETFSKIFRSWLFTGIRGNSSFHIIIQTIISKICLILLEEKNKLNYTNIYWLHIQ